MLFHLLPTKSFLEILAQWWQTYDVVLKWVICIIESPKGFTIIGLEHSCLRFIQKNSKDTDYLGPPLMIHLCLVILFHKR